MGWTVSLVQRVSLLSAILALAASGFAQSQPVTAMDACQQSNYEIAQDIAAARTEVDSCRARLDIMPSSCGEGFEVQPIALACVTKLRDANPSSPLTVRAFDLLDANRSILRARVIWAKAEADVADYRASGATDVNMVAAQIRAVARADIANLPR